MQTTAHAETAAQCRALFIAAPASGQGKTTVTAAIARYLTQQGLNVRVFKTGPDYLDPQILAQASGNPVEQLDLWMAGETYCRQMLHDAAKTSDIVLIEGVMGLFDGDPSSADLAAQFNIPIALVMNVKGMAQTTGALVAGLVQQRSDINIVGLIANQCSTQRHTELIEESLPASVALLATLPLDANAELPQRHLGLVQADEVREQLEARLVHGAKLVEQGFANMQHSTGFDLTRLPLVDFPAPDRSLANELAQTMELDRPLDGIKIAIAKDVAFSFIYAANVKLLEHLGAQCVYFSPIHDAKMPEADALWLPGGYPELHANALAKNKSMQQSIIEFFESEKPILAECGGLLYCLSELTDFEEQNHSMLGLISGHGFMGGKRGCQGMQTAPLPEGDIRGHAHHRSRCDSPLTPIAFGRRQRHSANGEKIFRQRGLTASYLHLFFPSNPKAIAALFRAEFLMANTSNAEKEADYVR